MFRAVKIIDIIDGSLNEESLVVEDAFFFTIKVQNYYLFYNKMAEVIGVVPMDYNMFFKIDNSNVFEDIDMENLLRLYNRQMDFSIVGTKEGSNKVTIVKSSEIARIELIEDEDMTVPFTNDAFDSEGIVIFKNMNSLADSIKLDQLM